MWYVASSAHISLAQLHFLDSMSSILVLGINNNTLNLPYLY